MKDAVLLGLPRIPVYEVLKINMRLGETVAVSQS